MEFLKQIFSEKSTWGGLVFAAAVYFLPLPDETKPPFYSAAVIMISRPENKGAE